MIEIRSLAFRYPQEDKPSLVIDELIVTEGECVVLCGPSGSGKTTLIRLLNGLIPEYYEGSLEGYCRIGDTMIGEKGVEVLSQQVGTVFQNPATQFFHKIVEHELVFPCENQCLIQELIQKRLAETTAFFGIEHLLQRNLLTASGGERQRIAMATAMMQRPRLLVLDEPTANLDELGIKQVAQHIKQLKRLGITVIIAEHRLDFLKELADRYLYIDKGRLTHEWSKQEWLSFDNQTRAQLGLRSLNQEQKKLTQFCHEEQGLLITTLSLRTADSYLGQIKHLLFPANKVVALVGPNGLGKSTLAHILSGLAHADGTISLFNRPLSDKDRLRHTSFVMQDVRLQLFSESVDKEIKLGTHNHDVQEAKTIVNTLGLSDLLDRHPMSLSGGEQQRVLIANSLLAHKSIYIFDEPTSGLDYQQMKQVANLLKKLKTKDRVIIVITHDQELIAEACDAVIDLRAVLE
ncbi:ABC transporter ATP-binding protein [Streptococcus fryi]